MVFEFCFAQGTIISSRIKLFFIFLQYFSHFYLYVFIVNSSIIISEQGFREEIYLYFSKWVANGLNLLYYPFLSIDLKYDLYHRVHLHLNMDYFCTFYPVPIYVFPLPFLIYLTFDSLISDRVIPSSSICYSLLLKRKNFFVSFVYVYILSSYVKSLPSLKFPLGF